MNKKLKWALIIVGGVIAIPLLTVVFLTALFGEAGSGSIPEYTIVEKEEAEAGYKSTVRLYTEHTDEESIKEIVDSLNDDEFFGSGSIHAWVHEPPNEELNDYGKLVAIAKYAHTNEGLGQTGVEETGKVYVEFK